MKAEILGISQTVRFETGIIENFLDFELGGQKFQASITDKTAMKLISIHRGTAPIDPEEHVPTSPPAPPVQAQVESDWPKPQVHEEDADGNVIFGGVVPSEVPKAQPEPEPKKAKMRTNTLSSLPALTVQKDANGYPILHGSGVVDVGKVVGNVTEDEEVQAL